ncbi:uncharacterized protein LOC6649080 [Drosophila willistoni]|uniref:uncharacterized protein LOC6649080 n=1 Tax=Drosophila willistoni TaxID=7260 RepID=UPI001F0809C1|nr:uncharacterized protein LOC6649080 [Drosophila willistoni]
MVTSSSGAAAAATAKATATADIAKQEAKYNKNAEFPEEDSDMLMEPNDFTPITVLRSHEQHFHMPPTTQLHGRVPDRSDPEQEQFRPIQQQQLVHPQQHPQLVISRADTGDSHSQAAQNFYPPFYHEAPPLGHSRPYLPGPENSPLSLALPLPGLLPGQQSPQQQQHQQQHLHPHQHPQHQQQRAFDTSILGSGDFGVLRGGTFYPEEEMPYHPEDNSDYIYGDAANNGHGRPTEGFIQKYTYPEEQFANFRDFADINTPADSAFSQFVVVYAPKNATKPPSINDQRSHPHPKNIFEQLELLDREKALEEAAMKKQPQQPSKIKTKLNRTKLHKNYKKKVNPKDSRGDTDLEMEQEPLLALS